MMALAECGFCSKIDSNHLKLEHQQMKWSVRQKLRHQHFNNAELICLFANFECGIHISVVIGVWFICFALFWNSMVHVSILFVFSHLIVICGITANKFKCYNYTRSAINLRAWKIVSTLGVIKLWLLVTNPNTSFISHRKYNV